MIRKIHRLLRLYGGKDIIVTKKLTLSAKIILLLVSSGILSILCYGLCRYYVTDFYEFVRVLDADSFDIDEFASDFEKKAKNVAIYSDDKKEKKKMTQLLKAHDRYTGVHLYDIYTGLYIAGNYGDILEEAPSFLPITPLLVLQNDFEQYSYNMGIVETIQFKDGEADVRIYDMHDLKYSKYYFYATLILCLLSFFLPTFIFIRYKVKYINCLKKEVLNMAHGDLQHPITIQSYDELAVLAKEMDSLRITLDQNIHLEAQTRQANHELITSLSHDLRTPLTSLMGYLDILRLHRYQSNEQMNKYIQNCIEKVDQINELSHKTFEYALVFDQNQDVEFNQIPSLDLIHYLDENLDYLQLEGFTIEKNYDYSDVILFINLAMFKRMINNICSNIHKYALSSQPVFINVSIQQNQMRMIFSNEKRKDIAHIESNQIGLKSVERIVKIHHGEVFIQDLETSYMIVITIPY